MELSSLQLSFISHTWMHNFLDVLDALEEHFKDEPDKARTTPKSAGLVEENLALKDLSSTIAIEANNKVVKRV